MQSIKKNNFNNVAWGVYKTPLSLGVDAVLKIMCAKIIDIETLK